MRYLIDTNIFIRLIEDNEISDGTKTILEDYGNIINVSSESIKEFVHLVQPSDRLIISQALTEKLPLISSDTKFPKYRKQGLDLIFNR